MCRDEKIYCATKTCLLTVYCTTGGLRKRRFAWIVARGKVIVGVRGLFRERREMTSISLPIPRESPIASLVHIFRLYEREYPRLLYAEQSFREDDDRPLPPLIVLVDDTGCPSPLFFGHGCDECPANNHKPVERNSKRGGGGTWPLYRPVATRSNRDRDRI